jgi:hypothetical protein
MIAIIVAIAALDSSKKHRSRAQEPVAGVNVPTSAPGVYLLPNSGGTDYAENLARFFEDHAGEDCRFVGDYITEVGRTTFGHYFRCTCPDSDNPPPCNHKNGTEEAQDVTKE